MAGRRKFDRDEIRQLREEGLSYRAIAARVGAHVNTVILILRPDYAANQSAYRSKWQRRARCPDCGTQTTRVRVGGDHRCRPCAAVVAATSVRASELKCVTCGEWKPDEAFPRSRSESGLRRGHHAQCQSCNTIARREYRRRNREAENAYSRAYKRRRREAMAATEGTGSSA